MGWLQLHERRQHMQDVEQFSRVFGQPMVGLDVAELGRRPAITELSVRSAVVTSVDGFDVFLR